MTKAFLLAVVLAVALTPTTPAAGQEQDPAAQPRNVGGLSYSGCEDLLSKYGADQYVTEATPPEQVLYCLDEVPYIPPASVPVDDASDRCPEPTPGDGRIIDCVPADDARIIRALDEALPGTVPEGIIGPDDPGEITARVPLPDTGGILLLALGAGTLLCALGLAAKRRMR